MIVYEPITQREAIDAIAALAEVIKANKGFALGDEDTIEQANAKIKELIPLININPPKIKYKNENK